MLDFHSCDIFNPGLVKKKKKKKTATTTTPKTAKKTKQINTK